MTSTLALYAITAALLTQAPSGSGRLHDEQDATDPGAVAPAPGDLGQPAAPPGDSAYGAPSSAPGEARARGHRPSVEGRASPAAGAAPAEAAEESEESARAARERWGEDQSRFQQRTWRGP